MPAASGPLPRVGFIGVGAMGGPMALSLRRAGYPVRAFDTDAARLARLGGEAGVSAADRLEALLDPAAPSDVICLSLPSSDAFVRVADAFLLPRAAAPGRIFIDFGTTTPPETRRIAAGLAARGASLIDAPVSGGPGGAERARLRTFAGGEPDVFGRIRPILETIGGAEGLTYCGPAGTGQIVKGVNQLAMGLGAAAFLEAVAFGTRAGVDAAIIGRAVGAGGAEAEAWRVLVAQTAEAAAEGRAEGLGVKFRELPYFLREAAEQGVALPLTETLYRFCDAGERVVTDDNRPAPSFWHELCTRKNGTDGPRP
jgi:3-hydroxyisobutyrate dehydrogenase-like beta-hydroxyacid dehydrogenase